MSATSVSRKCLIFLTKQEQGFEFTAKELAEHMEVTGDSGAITGFIAHTQNKGYLLNLGKREGRTVYKTTIDLKKYRSRLTPSKGGIKGRRFKKDVKLPVVVQDNIQKIETVETLTRQLLDIVKKLQSVSFNLESVGTQELLEELKTRFKD
jgi:hypothetical protein